MARALFLRVLQRVVDLDRVTIRVAQEDLSDPIAASCAHAARIAREIRSRYPPISQALQDRLKIVTCECKVY